MKNIRTVVLLAALMILLVSLCGCKIYVPNFLLNRLVSANSQSAAPDATLTPEPTDCPSPEPSKTSEPEPTAAPDYSSFWNEVDGTWMCISGRHGNQKIAFLSGSSEFKFIRPNDETFFCGSVETVEKRGTGFFEFSIVTENEQHKINCTVKILENGEILFSNSAFDDWDGVFSLEKPVTDFYNKYVGLWVDASSGNSINIVGNKHFLWKERNNDYSYPCEVENVVYIDNGSFYLTVHFIPQEYLFDDGRTVYAPEHTEVYKVIASGNSLRFLNGTDVVGYYERNNGEIN